MTLAGPAARSTDWGSRGVSGGDYVHRDGQLLSGPVEELTDVRVGAEPQVAAVGEPGRKGLGDEQPGPSKARGDSCRFV